ncbi:MAG: TonB family protein [Cyanobacteria bacterium J06638_6]
MSLSEICSQQHQCEQQKLRQILLWGLLGSVGVHGAALSLSQLNLWPRVIADELTPIELIVAEPVPTEPETLPDPMAPAKLSTQTNDPAPAAASAPPRPAIVAPPTHAPPADEQVAPDLPAPAEDTQAESDFEEPESEEAEALAVAATSDLAEKLPADESQAGADPEVEPTEMTEGLRDMLQRLRDAQADTAPVAGELSESATAGEGTVPDPPAGDDVGVAAAPSNGTGAGQEQGSRTVACQDCARPSYPHSALEAGVEGQPMVRVDIHPDGSVRGVTLMRSSGNAAIDQAAIEAARRSRFQPVAGGANVPIEYDLTIEGSRRNRAAERQGDRRSVEVPPSATTPPPAAVPSPLSESPEAGDPPSPATEPESPDATAAESTENPGAENAGASSSPPPESAPSPLSESAEPAPIPADDLAPSPPPEDAAKPEPPPDAAMPGPAGPNATPVPTVSAPATAPIAPLPTPAPASDSVSPQDQGEP